jgi:ABC-2 type transport system permease protein
MPAWLLPYLHFARCAFQRRAAYSLANWTGIAVNFFFFVIHAQVLLAFFGERKLAEGWRPEDAVLYFAASEALMMVLAVFPDWKNNLSEKIRTGAVATDLARPVNLLARDVAERFGNALYFMGARAVPLYLAALWLYDVAPPMQTQLLWFPLSLVLGISVSGVLWYVAASTAFWSESALGPMNAVVFIHTVLGGVVVPLDFYPEWLEWVCDALPFRAALYTPVALLTGQLQGAALVFGLAHQAIWLLLLTLAARVLETRGVQRMVIHGG